MRRMRKEKEKEKMNITQEVSELKALCVLAGREYGDISDDELVKQSVNDLFIVCYTRGININFSINANHPIHPEFKK